MVMHTSQWDLVSKEDFPLTPHPVRFLFVAAAFLGRLLRRSPCLRGSHCLDQVGFKLGCDLFAYHISQIPGLKAYAAQKVL